MRIRKLPLTDVIQESWTKVSGVKKIFFYSFLIVIAIQLLLAAASYLAHHHDLGLINIFSTLLNWLFLAGFTYMGIRRAFDAPINIKMLFKAFKWRLGSKVVIANLLATIIALLPTIFFFFVGALLPREAESIWKILTAISGLIGLVLSYYLMIRMMLTTSFIVAQLKGPLSAIGNSFSVTRGNFWRLTGLLIFCFILFGMSLLTFGIAFIWTFPYFTIMMGMTYKKLIEEPAVATEHLQAMSK